LADRGYAHDSCRLLRWRGIPHNIPEREDQKQWRARRGGRPPSDAYARRNAVERCTGRLKQSRVLATRYEERATNYRAVVVLPCGGCAIVPPFRIDRALHYDTLGLHI